MRAAILTTAVALLGMLGSSKHCLAQESPPIVLTAGSSIQTDSNLFRLPASTNMEQRIGRNNAAETIRISSVGIRTQIKKSLQRFSLDSDLTRYQYQNFNYLNFDARNYKAAWNWSITPDFTGELTSTRKETLNSFIDTVGIDQRNLRTDNTQRATANWALEGGWHLHTGIENVSQLNQQELLAHGDYEIRTAEIGGHYKTKSASSIRYTHKKGDGTYLHRSLPNANLLDNQFQQSENQISIVWDGGSQRTVQSRIAHIHRQHATYHQRNYDGYNAELQLQLPIAKKTGLQFSGQQSLAPYLSNNTNYTRTLRTSIASIWQASSLLSLRFSHSVAQIAYLGSPHENLHNSRHDITQETSLSVQWQVHRKVNFTATGQSSARSSNLENQDYASTQWTFSAQLSL